MKTITFLLSVTFTCLTLSSCNTYIGLSRDMQKLGQKMERKAYEKSAPPAPQTPKTTTPRKY